MSTVKQQYGIKYPFTNNSQNNYFVDTNLSLKDKYRALISHVIFTPKGQRVRDPNFGTNLIKFIFENSDDSTFELIRGEIIKSVSEKVPNVLIKDVSVLKNDENNGGIYVKVEYTFGYGMLSNDDSFIIEL